MSPGDPPAETADPSLQHDIDALALPGLSIGYRLISPGDEHALLDAEAASIASSVAAARRASGAARIVARRLLAPFGYAGFALRRGASGEPLWPAGITGSLAHDDTVAVAAVGRKATSERSGSTSSLPCRCRRTCSRWSRRRRSCARIADDPLQGRLLFAAKEAVYKACYPLDRVFLEFHDIEVDLAGCKAVTKTGRVVALRYRISSHVLVLAQVRYP